MSIAEAPEHKQEIIIVRRGHDEHDDHHGGVWKIAFADFMTAMMCFFLVMWLINAANEQTKAAVASYFNPVKLIDRNASRKGLEDLGDGPRAAGISADNPKNPAESGGLDGNGDGDVTQDKQAEASKPAESSDDHLFANPYAVLAEIAADTDTLQNTSQKGDGGAQLSGPATGASGGAAYRDPFAPDFWSQQVVIPDAEASAERARIDSETLKPDEKPAESAQPAPAPVDVSVPAMRDGKSDAAEKAQGNAGKELTQEAAAQDKDLGPSPEALKEAAKIKQQIAKALGSGDRTSDGVSVEATDKGVVISVTDQLDFGMFEIGSATPRRELVLALEKIGRIIDSHKGTITINGHTDARPFRGGTYDNWRLSSARAQSAYYMLVRGGVDERRIVEVAGFADRKPKDAADPNAASNRRIEILLEAAE